jgi:hypothetical protein
LQAKAHTPVDTYVVERPNGSTSFLEAMDEVAQRNVIDNFLSR